MVKPKVKKNDATDVGLEASSDSPDASPPPAPDECEPSNKALLTAINSIKSELCTTLDTRISEIFTTIRGEISSLNQSIQASISDMKNDLARHDNTLTELQDCASGHSDTIATLEATVERLCTDLKRLDEKCEDLEARSRRNNVRISGIPEGTEGPRMTEFVSQLLAETLSLAEKPLIDRAHRVNRQRPKQGDPPRPIILRLHYYHVREEILRKATENRNLMYKGVKINIFPDFPPSVAKRRAAFTKVREMLRGMPDVR